MSDQVENVLYHHKFTPWMIADDKCIVSDQCDWLELDNLNKKAAISGEKIRIWVDADICQEWDGDIHLSDGEIAGVECAGGAMMKINIGKIRQRLFAIIDETPNLTWMLWTSHPKKINRIWPKYDNNYQPGPDNVRMEFGNVWLGVRCSNQDQVDNRIPELRDSPAAIWFALVDPLIEEIDLDGKLSVWRCSHCGDMADLMDSSWRKSHRGFQHHHGADVGHVQAELFRGIDLVIVGGDTGPNHSCNIEWIRSIVGDCQSANVACFVTQLGSRVYKRSIHSGNPVEPLYPLTFKDKTGSDMSEWPEDLRVRELPE